MIKINILICGDINDKSFIDNINFILSTKVLLEKISFRLIVVADNNINLNWEKTFKQNSNFEVVYQYLDKPTRADIFQKILDYVDGTHIVIFGNSFKLKDNWIQSIINSINRYPDHIICHGGDKSRPSPAGMIMDRFGLQAAPLEYLEGIATIFPIKAIELIHSVNPQFVSNTKFDERGITDLELTYKCISNGTPIIVSETFQIGYITSIFKSNLVRVVLATFKSFNYGWNYLKFEAYLVKNSEFIRIGKLKSIVQSYKTFLLLIFNIKGPEVIKIADRRFFKIYKTFFLFAQALYVTFRFSDFKKTYSSIKINLESAKEKLLSSNRQIFEGEFIDQVEVCDHNANLNLIELNQRKLILESYPVKLYVEPSDMCNLSCTYCYPSSVRKKVNMDMELFKQIESQLFSKASEVNLFLTGEPTLHPQFNKMLDICSQYHFTTKFFSNLSYRNDSILDQMVDTGVFLNVSFDGPKDNSKLRVGINEDLVLKNIRRMLERKEKTNNKKFHLRMASVVSKTNTKQLTDIIEFANDLGINELMFGCIDLPGGVLNPLSLTSEDSYLFEKAMDSANKIGMRLTMPTHIGGQRLKKSSNINDFKLESDSYFRRYTELYNPDVESKFCPYPWIETVIHSDGRISSCCQRKHQIAFWDKSKTDFMKDVWNNQNYQKLRNIPDYNFCSSCSERYQCNMMKYSIWGGYSGATYSTKN